MEGLVHSTCRLSLDRVQDPRRLELKILEVNFSGDKERRIKDTGSVTTLYSSSVMASPESTFLISIRLQKVDFEVILKTDHFT